MTNELTGYSVAIGTGASPITLTVGLLGIEVSTSELDRGRPNYLVNLRLDEIERRILAIEARLPTPPNMTEGD